MKNKTELDRLHLVFSLVLEYLSPGGEVEGYIISKEYKRLADIFEKWQKEHGEPFPVRSNSEVYRGILFTAGPFSEEVIVFTDDPSIGFDTIKIEI